MNCTSKGTGQEIRSGLSSGFEAEEGKTVEIRRSLERKKMVECFGFQAEEDDLHCER